MVPKQSELTAAQAEELLQISLGLITDFLHGRGEIVISPTEGGAFMHLLYGRDGLLR